jgi:multiple antibiotic resistance protein
MVHIVPVTFANIAQFFAVALTSTFFLVDPIAAVPAFLIMTDSAEPEHRRRMAKRAAWTCFVVLSIFAVGGTLIFKLFGITLPAFRIAGGLILLFIGMDMLQARRPKTKETPTETEEALEREDVGIIPLGIPMLAGPGSISTVMVMMGGAPAWWYAIPLFLAIGMTAFASYWILAAANRVRGYLGETGIRVLTRLMGLLLTAIAVQFILNGLTDVPMLRSSK